MIELREALAAFLDDPAGLALKAAVIAAAADFLTGTFAALRDNTFALDAVAAWLRKHLMGRVGPLGALLGLHYFGGESGVVFLPIAIAGLAAYALETVASVKANLMPPAPSEVKEDRAEAIGNPVPTE
jgi:hypothetical protein